MRLTVVGCSDAFGSGGRFHSCYLLETSQGRLLVDCGANSPLALKRANIKLSSIDAFLISHLHGDHFGGLPFLFLDKMFVDQSPAPIEILGPPGIEARTVELMECLYPGVYALRRGFDIIYRELEPGQTTRWRGLEIAAYEVQHYSGAPSLAFSIADGEGRFAFSGDSGWCDGVIQAGRRADVYLIECSTYATKTDMHLDYLTLASKFSEIGAKKYLLTHMGEEMLAKLGNIDTVNCIAAEDGLSVAIGAPAEKRRWPRLALPGFR
ncbi:MAG: MBL fold metallo-hydrolase [Rhodomicrobium sp.]